MTFSVKIDKGLRFNVKSLKYVVGAYSLSKHKTAGGALLFLVILWVPPKPPVARYCYSKSYYRTTNPGIEKMCRIRNKKK